MVRSALFADHLEQRFGAGPQGLLYIVNQTGLRPRSLRFVAAGV
jgi:hypothetical protein